MVCRHFPPEQQQKKYSQSISLQCIDFCHPRCTVIIVLVDTLLALILFSSSLLFISMMLLVGGQRSTPSFGSMRAGLALLAIFGSLSLTMINRHDWQQEQQQHDSSGVGTSPLPKIKNFRADTVSSLVPMKDSEDQASLEPIHDTISSAPTDSLVPSMIGKPESIGKWNNDLNVVHIIHTRFMQHQPDLIHLGQARMDLFQTFTLPSIQQQTNQQFLWLIWTDQDLHQDLRRQLLDAVDHLDNAVVLGAAPPVKHTNLRNAFGHSLSTLVSHGNVWKNPQSLLDYFKASQTHLLLETQLDADDSLTATFVDTIQAQAAETVGQHEQEFLHKTMEIVCPSKHLEWRYYVGKELGEREVDAEYKSSSPGYWIEFENHDFCINSGMTYIFHLRADMRQLHLNHQCNYGKKSTHYIWWIRRHRESFSNCFRMFLMLIIAYDRRTPTLRGSRLCTGQQYLSSPYGAIVLQWSSR